MPTVHLLHGLPGVGKTTFARQLEARHRAMRFTHDEWMTALFGHNPPAGNFADYHQRILALMWQQTTRLVNLGTDVILDHGFWTRTSRNEARDRVRELGGEPKLYRILCADDIAEARVLSRSEHLAPGVLHINAEALKSFRSRFEPLDPDEEHIDIVASLMPSSTGPQ